MGPRPGGKYGISPREEEGRLKRAGKGDRDNASGPRYTTTTTVTVTTTTVTKDTVTTSKTTTFCPIVNLALYPRGGPVIIRGKRRREREGERERREERGEREREREREAETSSSKRLIIPLSHSLILSLPPPLEKISK